MGPRTATVKALIHRIRTAEATQPPAYGLGPRHQHQPSFLVCLFLPSAWLRMVSLGSGPRPGSQIPLMVALEAMGSKWMIISGLCVSCFDRSWDIELSRAGEAMVTIRPTNYPAGCCGHWMDTRSLPPVLGDIIPWSPLAAPWVISRQQWSAWPLAALSRPSQHFRHLSDRKF